MRKFVDYFLVLIALVIAVVFYFNFNLEGILWERREQIVIDAEQLKADTVTDYTGLTAGENIVSLSTEKEWEAVLNESDYATAVPVDIKKTGIYSLSKWIEHYTKRASGTAGRRLAEAEKRILDYSSSYSPYYIIELQDGYRLLAQMNRGLAKRIEKGEEVKLPLGRKIGLSNEAIKLLTPICEEWDVSTKYVLYTIDNYWSAKNADKIKYGKYGASVAVWLILSILLQVLADKLFPKSRDDQS